MIAETRLMLAAFTHLFPKFHKYVASTVKQNVKDGRKDAERSGRNLVQGSPTVQTFAWTDSEKNYDDMQSKLMVSVLRFP
jgi:hypothetical protein